MLCLDGEQPVGHLSHVYLDDEPPVENLYGRHLGFHVFYLDGEPPVGHLYSRHLGFHVLCLDCEPPIGHLYDGHHQAGCE